MKNFFTSVLIPYYFKEDSLYVFLQRRSADAPRGPNGLGAFGGGIEENENDEEALVRELQEELKYAPKRHEKLGIFETDNYISHCYIEKVEKNFENIVKVYEGKRGEWHKAIEVIERDDVLSNTLKAVNMMLKKLISKQVLQSEGFTHVYEWHDEPNTEYPIHAHKGKVTLFVEKGDVTFHFSDNTTHIVKTGERFDVPLGLEHSAVVGPNGCDYVVGEMIEGDS